MQQKSMYYGDYLEIDKIINSQHPVSFMPPNEPAHDELLFIIIHQAYELWFKQVLFELDSVIAILSKNQVDDNAGELNVVENRLQRIIKIFELLNMQVNVLDTMTPSDFLAFRNLLSPSSGFQSLQFRLIEAKLGLTTAGRHKAEYYKRTNEGGFSTQDYTTLSETEINTSILQLVKQWLERMPFFDISLWEGYERLSHENLDAHPFWNDYAALYRDNLTEREADKMQHFNQVILGHDESLPEEVKAQLPKTLGPTAMRSALFIMLHRDMPVFHASFRILDSLIEIDHLMSNWRYKHYVMTRRMIGMRVGTGNTSGGGYLEGALQSHYVFKDLAALSTYLIESKKLPRLPAKLIKHLSFYE
jgi:tryptophan 2,3-dioxygenase